MRIIYWVGGSLIVAGAIILVTLYYRELFESPQVPLLVKLAVPAITIGTLILLAGAIVQRFQAKQKETFKEQDY